MRSAQRSGLAVKGIDVGAGVIDQDFRGELHALMLNTTSTAFVLEAGSRVAQLLVLPCLAPEVEVVEELSSTERGSGGFGSTGL